MTEEAEIALGDDQDYSGWFCLATSPWECPNPHCDFVAMHVTAMHLIVVWPEKDDPNLLSTAESAKRYGRNPRVVEYEQPMGHAISYYQLRSLRLDGKMPVHGQRSG